MNGIQCLNCGENFLPKTKISKHCSRLCQGAARSRKFYHKNADIGHLKICFFCKKDFRARQKRNKFCSDQCRSDTRKKYFSIPECLDDPKRKIDKNIGYVRIYVPMHPEANSWGYVYEHRIIAEQIINRRLVKNEVVHHKNGIRWDNRIENLEVMDAIEHAKMHSK